MDTEILQGSTIEIEYEMNVSNESEIETVNENLNEIRYAIGAANKGYIGVYYGDNYSANGTAAEMLSRMYYERMGRQDYYDKNSGKEVYRYLKRIKKPYNASGETKTREENNREIKLGGKGYYGMYIGSAYYTGSNSGKDVIAQLKVDRIIDYVDNDFTFNQTENSMKNKLWETKKFQVKSLST